MNVLVHQSEGWSKRKHRQGVASHKTEMLPITPQRVHADLEIISNVNSYMRGYKGMSQKYI